MAHIEIKLPDRQKVLSLLFGDWFIYKGFLFMRLGYNGDNVECFCLDNGRIKALDARTLVTKVDNDRIHITIE